MRTVLAQSQKLEKESPALLPGMQLSFEHTSSSKGTDISGAAKGHSCNNQRQRLLLDILDRRSPEILRCAEKAPVHRAVPSASAPRAERLQDAGHRELAP